MARIRIELPTSFPFTTSFPVRITDINYGGHGGNDSILGMIHEARMQFLAHHGYTEMEFEGVGMIMSDVAIEFKNELFYGETVLVSVAPSNFSRSGFELYYKLEKMHEGSKLPVAFAKTGMVCFDYKTSRIVSLPTNARRKMEETS